MSVKKGKPQRLVKIKSKAQYDALNRLNSFINSNDRRLVRFLARMWGDQQDAITYKELREALIAGVMSEEVFIAWQHDYVVFYNEYLKDVLKSAAMTGGMETLGDLYRPMNEGIDNWLVTHGAEWITQMSDEAKEAVSSMVGYSTRGGLTVDELARVIRPTIGLTRPQSEANMNFYINTKDRLKKQYMDNNPNMKEATAEKKAAAKAQDAAYKYAGRQHRQRAQSIAQTELAYAYNKGAYEAVEQAVAHGYMPRMKAQWSTAADESVCEVCGGLDGMEVELGDNFVFGGRSQYRGQKQSPPAHPNCRCALCFVEA